MTPSPGSRRPASPSWPGSPQTTPRPPSTPTATPTPMMSPHHCKPWSSPPATVSATRPSRTSAGAGTVAAGGRVRRAGCCRGASCPATAVTAGRHRFGVAAMAPRPRPPPWTPGSPALQLRELEKFVSLAALGHTALSAAAGTAPGGHRGKRAEIRDHVRLVEVLALSRCALEPAGTHVHEQVVGAGRRHRLPAVAAPMRRSAGSRSSTGAVAGSGRRPGTGQRALMRCSRAARYSARARIFLVGLGRERSRRGR